MLPHHMRADARSGHRRGRPDVRAGSDRALVAVARHFALERPAARAHAAHGQSPRPPPVRGVEREKIAAHAAASSASASVAVERGRGQLGGRGGRGRGGRGSGRLSKADVYG